MISTEKQPAVGYKQTELGEIPEDWEIEKIGRIVSITTGNRNTQDRLPDGKYPFFVRSQKVERIDSYSFDGEAVLTAGDGVGTGKIFHYINGKFDYHQRVYLIHNFGDRIAGYYFYIYFSNFFYDRIMSMTAKSSVDSVRRETISEMQISLPPKEEQTAIANALSDVDSLLNELETLISKKQAIKTATMQQLLTGKTRLPQFARYTEGEKQGLLKGMKDSELGEIPEDWDIYAIGALFSIAAGGDLRKTQFSPIKTDKHPYPIYSNGITNKGLYGYCSTFDYDGEYLTITARGGIGHAIERNESFCAIGRLLVLSSKQNTNCKYVAEFTNQYIEFANESTGVPQLTAPQVAKYNIALPEFEEQTAIADILSDIDEEIQALEQRLAKTRQIKQGMMQELLTGRTRLPFKKES